MLFPRKIDQFTTKFVRELLTIPNDKKKVRHDGTTNLAQCARGAFRFDTVTG